MKLSPSEFPPDYLFACRQGADLTVKHLEPEAKIEEIEFALAEFLRGCGFNHRVTVNLEGE